MFAYFLEYQEIIKDKRVYIPWGDFLEQIDAIRFKGNILFGLVFI